MIDNENAPLRLAKWCIGEKLEGMLGVDCQSPRIARIYTDYLSFTIKIRVNPRDTLEGFPSQFLPQGGG